MKATSGTRVLCVLATGVIGVAAGAVATSAAAAAPATWHILAGVSCAGNQSIWSMNPDGSNKQLVLADASHPAASPDGTQLAYATADGVHVSNISSITPTAANLVAPGDTYPSWSPDGTQLVVEHDGSPSPELQIVDLAAHTAPHSLSTPAFGTQPAWGSNGIIAFTLSATTDTTSSLGSVDPTGNPATPLGYPEQSAQFPSWSSNGILAAADSGGAIQLFLPSDYTSENEYPTSLPALSSAWQPDSTEFAYGIGSAITGSPYVSGDFWTFDYPTETNTLIWDWTDVPEYWAIEFGGVDQGDCGQSVANPTWLLSAGGTTDATPPTVNCGSADSSWHASDVSIACTASDAGSGLATSSDAAFSLTTNVASGTETANASTGTRQVCDIAGNCATAGPVTGNKVDKAAPTITLTAPANGATITQGATVAASYSCADAGSGVASCTGTSANGAPINTTAAGPHTFAVTSTDNVGNTTSKQVSYTVVAASSTPALSIADASGNEGNFIIGNTLLFKITLSKAATARVSVRATPHPGTATTPSDYLAVPLTITLRAGQTTAYYPVLLRGDRIVEPNETFTVVLSAPNGATIARSTATGTIINDDH